MKLSNILPAQEYLTDHPLGDPEITDVTDKPCNVTEGCLFFLIRGFRFDAEKLLISVLSRRPAAVVVERIPEGYDNTIPLLLVPSVRRAYAFALYRFLGIDGEKLNLIGITGTNGKTTTASLLFRILSEAGHRVGMFGTGQIRIGDRLLTASDYAMTTPDPDVLYPALKQMLQEGVSDVVMEVSSHALALDKVAPLFFSYGIFTNLSAEHLDFHTTMEDYYAAKSKLFRQCRIGIVNADDAWCDRIIRDATCQIVRVGAVFEGDIMAKNIRDLGMEGSSFLFRAPGLSFLVSLKLPGLYNIYNATLALTAAISMGIPPCQAKESVASLPFVPGRLETVCESPRVIVDYAHTEAALRSVLKTVCQGKPHDVRAITVFGCGGERDREKRPKMAAAAEEFSDYTIVTSDNSRGEATADILRDILRGFHERTRHCVISDRKHAIEAAVEMATDRDIIIVAGKGHERYITDKAGTHPFDERKIILEAVKKKKGGHTNQHEDKT